MKSIYQALENNRKKNNLSNYRTLIEATHWSGIPKILVSHAFTEAEIETEDLYRQLILGRLSVNEGMIFENAIM